MAEATANSTENVSVGKGIKGGYFYSAPTSAALPTDFTAKLASGWVLLGYVSEDGVTEGTDEDTTDVVDMNGDTVLSEQASYTKTFQIKLIETKASVLKEYFGEGAVTDAAGVIEVVEKAGARTYRAYALDLVLSGKRPERIVVPKGKVTEVGEITYAAGEVIGYEITVTAFPDEDGAFTRRYVKSTETQGASGASAALPAGAGEGE